MTAPDITFVPDTVLKRDVFSETVSGHAAEDPAHKLALRKLDALPWATRPVARLLARREVRGLRAVQGIAGTPTLHRADRTGILRDWAEGTPLQLAKPRDPAWYADARRLLREMRRRGVTHNDLAKPQNWLMTPDGRAAVIDFQLARTHARKGRWFRLSAYEDLRHLIKMKRKFAPQLMTPTERRIAGRRSLPSRAWRATVKPVYNFVTRRLMNWSDAEGAGLRLSQEGPKIRDTLLAHPQVTGAALSTFPQSGHGVGLYAFVETPLDRDALRRLVPADRVEHVQPVPALPRTEGEVRQDVLDLVAMNRIDELETLLAREPALADTVRPIVAGRENLTDRQLRKR
ncbi:phosphotransferase [Tranquillimonas alkanivorans]|uniref:Serine/threonine protein kinase n=1 Tax=Tranquillimonas alkanivorans TaxID=441119 RepID=A0A1I5L044_9RHOB|nr:phosphotransferase [Tranquillimonas alkanivorans]SFO90704.1 serine/threonine protein kinase [Tranquillimonas alkanivorans]